jgi:hypothetical protein
MFHGDINGIRTEPVRNLRHIDHQKCPVVGTVMYEMRDIPPVGKGLCHICRTPLYFQGRRLKFKVHTIPHVRVKGEKWI